MTSRVSSYSSATITLYIFKHCGTRAKPHTIYLSIVEQTYLSIVEQKQKTHTIYLSIVEQKQKPHTIYLSIVEQTYLSIVEQKQKPHTRRDKADGRARCL